MKKKLLENSKDEIGWAYAIINGRLGSVWFEVGKDISGIFAHGYLDNQRKFTKREQRMIDIDTKMNKFSYRKEKYKKML